MLLISGPTKRVGFGLSAFGAGLAAKQPLMSQMWKF